MYTTPQTKGVKLSDQAVVLRANNIRKAYGGVKALDGVTLEIHSGEVMCLAGSNGCGKSTLIKILAGVERLDSGTVTITGEENAEIDVLTAIRKGIQVIFQDMSIFPNLTVSENICFSGRIAENVKTVQTSSEEKKAEAVLNRLGVKIDLRAEVQELPIADRQIVAIARALYRDVKVLFMDEPTTALTWKEVQNLFTVVKRLKKDGVAVVFVSHKSEEVFEVSDRIVVMRNGRVVADDSVEKFNSQKLMEALLGYVANQERKVPTFPNKNEPALKLSQLSARRIFEDINLTVASGEIVGLTGLLGSGRTEVAEAVFGRIKTDEGEILVDGKPINPSSPKAAIEAGIAYVPPDRLTQGVFLRQSIALNIVSAAIDRFCGIGGWLKKRLVKGTIDEQVEKLSIKIDKANDPVSSLSGGNQQKVVLAKWLTTKPRVLILNGPTVGVDIGAKAAIMDILRNEAKRGIGILLISDDIPELVSVCNRVVVMHRGRVVDEIAGADVNENVISRVLQEV